MRVSEIMTSAAVTDEPHQTLAEAARKMWKEQTGSLLVTQGEGLVGIVTERDVLTRVLREGADLDRPVDEFMTPDPDTLPAHATVLEAMQTMARGRYRNLPLIDDERNLVGLVRQQDLLDYVAEAFPQEILNLPPRPHQLMEQPEGG